LKARLAKVSKQTRGHAGHAGRVSRPSKRSNRPQQQAQAQAPPPDVLYNNGLRDYNGAKNDLAIQEFSDYIKFYPNTDLAGNAYFYLAEIQYKQGTFSRRCRITIRYSRIFPSGSKAASAQLKKGFALIELGKQDDGVRELRHLIQRYPHSNESPAGTRPVA